MVQMLLASTTRKTKPHSIFTSFILSDPASTAPLLGAAMAGRNRAPAQKSSPGRGPRLEIQHFGDPKARTTGSVRRQRSRIVEPAFHDLAVGLRQAVLAELPDDID